MTLSDAVKNHRILSGMDFYERKEANTRFFYENIAHLKSGWIELEAISKEAEEKAKTLELGLHKEKPKELLHQKDKYGRDRRFKSGSQAEARVKELFAVLSSFDTTVGESIKYNKADFDELNVGVKTALFGSVAMVSKNPSSHEIITSYTDEGDLYICGLATIEILKTHVHEKLINDKNPIERKTGFYGYKYLIPLHDYLTIPKIEQFLEGL